jgi:phosphate uptake regulator
MSSSKLSEETRKLQFTGGCTYIISLPKRWIEENQLNRGSSIRLRIEEDVYFQSFQTIKLYKKNPNEAILK